MDKGCNVYRVYIYGFWERNVGDGSVKEIDFDDM